MYTVTCIKNIFGICFNFLSLNTSMISLTGTLLSSLAELLMSWCVKMLSSNISKLSLSLWSSVFTIFPCEEMVIKIQPQGSDAHSSLTKNMFKLMYFLQCTYNQVLKIFSIDLNVEPMTKCYFSRYYFNK